MGRASRTSQKQVDCRWHRETRRKNIPTAKPVSLVSEAEFLVLSQQKSFIFRSNRMRSAAGWR